MIFGRNAGAIVFDFDARLVGQRQYPDRRPAALAIVADSIAEQIGYQFGGKIWVAENQHRLVLRSVKANVETRGLSLCDAARDDMGCYVTQAELTIANKCSVALRAIEHFVDMGRTATNVIGNSIAAVVGDHVERKADAEIYSNKTAIPSVVQLSETAGIKARVA